MKNVLNKSKKGILMVTMFVTLLSFANEESIFNIKNDAEKTSLTLNNVKQGNLLFIKNNNGIVLYKEQIEVTGVYTKGFDLTELPNGGYIFELEKDVEIQTIPFTVSENSVTFNKEKETTIYKPVTRMKDDVVFITRLSFNKSPMDIKIYFIDNEGNGIKELIYSETITDTEKANRIFKLTGKRNGNYNIVFTTDGRVFKEELY